MKQDFSTVIRARRGELGMNQARLAELAGVSRNAVAGWETGHSRPDLATVPLLCQALDLSLYAFFGVESPLDAQGGRLLRAFATLDKRDREALVWQAEAIAEGRRRQAAKREQAKRPVGAVPRFVTVYESDLGAAAGAGCALEEARGEEIYLLADEETERADEVITVSGRSMEPTFMNGDRVLVQHTDRVRPGEIGVFLVDNEGYIKEYQSDGLHSHNPAYGLVPLTGEESVRCVGRVIGKVKQDQIPSDEQLDWISEAVRDEERRKHHE